MKTVNIRITEIFIFLIMIIFISACEETTINKPNDYGNDSHTYYFPFELGKTFNLFYYDIDNNGIQKNEEEYGKLVCAEKIDIDSEEAYRFDQYNKVGIIFSSEIYTYKNGKLYLHNSFIKGMVEAYKDALGVELPFLIEEKWIAIFDVYNNKPISYSVTKNKDDIGENILTDGQLTYNITYIRDNEFQLNDSTFDCIAINFNVKYDGTVFPKYNQENKNILACDINVALYLANNFGKLYTAYYPSIIEYLGLKIPFGGYSIRCSND